MKAPQKRKNSSLVGGWKAPLEDLGYTSLLSLLFTRIESINVGDGSVSLKIIGQVDFKLELCGQGGKIWVFDGFTGTLTEAHLI